MYWYGMSHRPMLERKDQFQRRWPDINVRWVFKFVFRTDLLRRRPEWPIRYSSLVPDKGTHWGCCSGTLNEHFSTIKMLHYNIQSFLAHFPNLASPKTPLKATKKFLWTFSLFFFKKRTREIQLELNGIKVYVSGREGRKKRYTQ